GGRQPLVSADDTTEKMVNQLLKKVQLTSGDKAMVIINGIGATTHMELSIVFRKAYDMLTAMGVEVVSGRIAEILTVQEQAGFQMIMAKLDDDHVDYLTNYMSNAPYWTTIGK
ncbi:MAG: dihydroxyacetone kinase subunit DhaK, partial [Rikenellaceae bacterium]